MQSRSTIRFLLNDREVTLDDVRADATLLDYLRLDARLTGSKEGCAEGDCGACTVLVGRLADERLVYEPINACIRFLAACDGCHVITIEHVRGPHGGLHVVQQAMVAFDGSQCGFCTPGIVMALYALWMSTPKPSEADIETALQGNLCRCTGYAPIIRAAQAAAEAGGQSDDPLLAVREDVITKLAAMRDNRRVDSGAPDRRAILPIDGDDLAAVLQDHPQATIIAGATDVGLWVTKQLRDISPAVFIGHLDQMRRIEIGDQAVTIGAAATYEDLAPVITNNFPHFAEYWNRIAGWQIRAAGTIGGNIANGSPIGDTPPPFIAMGASLTLRRGNERRNLPLEAFFLDYGKQDLAPGEFVEAITLSLPETGARYAAYKISKRRDEDISAVAIGFNLTIADKVITNARIALGGMAGIPKRASAAENHLRNQPFTEASLMAAAATLPQDFAPLTDMRASAEYRMKVAQNLFRRFWLDQSDAPERLRA